MKKRTASAKTDKSALSSAIKDLEGELKRLGAEKTRIRAGLDGIDEGLELDAKKERELQDAMVRLAEKEAGLKKKKKELEMKFENVFQKMSKVSKIKAEMADV